MDKAKIIIINETVFQSFAKDAFTFGGALIVIGAGVFFQSPAMQWFGFISFWIWLISVSQKEAREMNIKQARRLLDEIEQGEQV